MRFEVNQGGMRRRGLEPFQRKRSLKFLPIGTKLARLPSQRFEKPVLRIHSGELLLPMKLVPSPDDAQKVPAHEFVVRVAAGVIQIAFVAEIHPGDAPETPRCRLRGQQAQLVIHRSIIASRLESRSHKLPE